MLATAFTMTALTQYHRRQRILFLHFFSDHLSKLGGGMEKGRSGRKKWKRKGEGGGEERSGRGGKGRGGKGGRGREGGRE
jgi:hypothetical protein